MIERWQYYGSIVVTKCEKTIPGGTARVAMRLSCQIDVDR